MIMDNRLVKIGEAAKLLGTSPDTLRKWEATVEL
jgi:DNA-binding transcriptional regulator YiaG